MTTDRSDPSLQFTTPFQLTKTIHRDVSPFLSPNRLENQETVKNKIIVITGGGSGIGAAAARVWVRAGAEGVVIAGRRKEALDKIAEELRGLNTGKTGILTVPTDITKESDTRNLFEEVKKVFGRTADVVLANAGFAPRLKALHEESVETWWKSHEVNVLGLHNTARSFILSQPDPANATGTFITVISSLCGMLAAGTSGYSTSKVAAHTYSEYLDLEYPRLRAFSLIPGVVATDMLHSEFEEYAKDAPELTGALGLYLASDRAEWLRGSAVSVNWDLEEMEAKKEEIVAGKLLKNKWLAVLPVSGGNGI